MLPSDAARSVPQPDSLTLAIPRPLLQMLVDWLSASLRSAEGKEEREQEEKVPPCTPFNKEETEKEEKRRQSSSPRCADTRQEFKIPTFQEVQDYLKKFSDANFDAGKFISYYTATGWRTTNGKPITNWKMAVEGWVRKSRPVTSASSIPLAVRQQNALAALEERDRQRTEQERRWKEMEDTAVTYEEYLRMKNELQDRNTD